MKEIKGKLETNKGFTLIELLVVIGVLGILVLLAMPMFGGYTKDAIFAKGIANAKMIKDASELYYMDNEDWPRLTDEHYTQEQMNEYAERFYDNTGKEIELDPNGKYYDINYDGLSKYVKVNDDKRNYILQNPVGKVFYMEDLSERGLERLNKPPQLEEPVVFDANSTFVVPHSGWYSIDVIGGKGGGGNGSYGGRVVAEKYLEEGQVLTIVLGNPGKEGSIGSSGLYRHKGGSGGGGSTAVHINNQLIVEAKGGLGARGYKNAYNDHIGMGRVGSGGTGYTRGSNGGGSLPTNNLGGAGGGSNRVANGAEEVMNVSSGEENAQVIIDSVWR